MRNVHDHLGLAQTVIRPFPHAHALRAHISGLSEYLNLGIRFFSKYLFFGIAHLSKP